MLTLGYTQYKYLIQKKSRLCQAISTYECEIQTIHATVDI